MKTFVLLVLFFLTSLSLGQETTEFLYQAAAAPEVATQIEIGNEMRDFSNEIRNVLKVYYTEKKEKVPLLDELARARRFQQKLDMHLTISLAYMGMLLEVDSKLVDQLTDASRENRARLREIVFKLRQTRASAGVSGKITPGSLGVHR